MCNVLTIGHITHLAFYDPVGRTGGQSWTAGDQNPAIIFAPPQTLVDTAPTGNRTHNTTWSVDLLDPYFPYFKQNSREQNYYTDSIVVSPDVVSRPQYRSRDATPKGKRKKLRKVQKVFLIIF